MKWLGFLQYFWAQCSNGQSVAGIAASYKVPELVEVDKTHQVMF